MNHCKELEEDMRAREGNENVRGGKGKRQNKETF